MVGISEIFDDSESSEDCCPVGSSLSTTVSEVDIMPLNILGLMVNGFLSIGISSVYHISIVIS